MLHIANLLAAGIAASHFNKCISTGGAWLRFERAITRTEDERATIVPASFIVDFFLEEIYADFQKFDLSKCTY